MNRIDWSSLFVIGMAFILIPLMLIGSAKERREWEEFKVLHKCHVVAEMPSELFNTFDGRNVGVGMTSAKEGWLCNDGITHYRDK